MDKEPQGEAGCGRGGGVSPICYSLAVLFARSLLMVIQRFEEWLKSRKAKPAAAAAAE